MGRRATRRRHKKKYNKRHSYHSEPEEFREPKTSDNDSRQEKWDSLDELALTDYANNAACNDPATVRDEMEVTRRLSSLNVSVVSCGNELTNDPCAIMTSDVETICSEFPPSATLVDSLPGDFFPLDRLKERQLRKRSCKRNRKRTKKAKALPSTEEGKHKRSFHVSSKVKFNPIAWVQPSDEQPSMKFLGSELSEIHQQCSDYTSSRSLTGSESPTLDDIIMIGSGPEEDDTGWLVYSNPHYTNTVELTSII